MPEKSLRGIISVAAAIVLAWIGAAIFSKVNETSFRWPFLIIWALLIASVLFYGIRHSLRARQETLDHGTHHGSRIKKQP